jgi:putative membrane protein
VQPDVEETDPDPRFTLANERTFLAWIRTALALIAAGLAATQVLPPFEIAGARRVLGLPLMGLGAATAFMSHRRWKQSERALRQGAPLPAPPLVSLLSVVIAIIGLLAAALVLFAT